MANGSNDFSNRLSGIFATLITLGVIVTAILGKNIVNASPWIVYPIAAATLCLIWFCRWWYEKNRQRRIFKQTIPQNKKSGFIGPLSYTKGNKDGFWGRESDIHSLQTQIMQDDYRLGVLYGKSGVGKTSLIQAGVMPRCEASYLCIYISLNNLPRIDSQDENQDLGILSFILSKVSSEFSGSNPISSFDELTKVLSAYKTRTIIIFLDQFEQIFDCTPKQIRNQYALDLKKLCAKHPGMFKIVISVRADHSEVAPLFGVEPKFTHHLQPFKDTQAREVIRCSYGLPRNLPEKEPDHPFLEFENKIIRDLQNADGHIHPVEISLICWTIMREKGELDKTQYIIGQRKQGWLNRYLDDVINSSPHKQQALPVLRSLIRNNKAVTLYPDEVSTKTGLSMANTQRLLAYFEQERLIVKENTELLSEHKYRLAHEYLISTIRLRPVDVETPDRLLLTRALAWVKEKHDRRYLLSWKEIYHFFRIKIHLNWKDNQELKRLFLRKSIIWRVSELMIYFSTLVILGLTLNYYRLIKDADSTMDWLKDKNVKQLTKMEGRLAEISSQPLFIKKRILSCLFSDPSEYYKDDIFPYIIHCVINNSPYNKKVLREYSLKLLSPANITNATRFVLSSYPDSTFKKRYAAKLAELLQKADEPSIKKNVVEALGNIGKEAACAVPSLIELLKKTRDANLQKCVATTLGNIGKNAISAVDPLIGQLKVNQNYYVRAEAIIALGKIGKENISVVPNLIDLLNKTYDVYLQVRFAKALGYIGKDAIPAIPSLINLLNEVNDPSHLKDVTDALGYIGERTPSKVVPLLIKSLNYSYNNVHQSSVAYTLGKFGKDAARAVPFLIKLLDENNDNVQESIINALGNIGKDAAPAVPILINLLDSTDDTRLQKSVAYALGGIGKDATPAVPSLINLLNNTDDTHLQKSVAYALGNIGKNAVYAVPSLINLINKTNSAYLQDSVAYALGNIGKDAVPAIIPHLIKFLWKTQNTYNQSSIIYALEKMGKADADSVINKLLFLFNTTEYTYVQRWAAYSLEDVGKKGDKILTSIMLKKYYKTTDNSVKYAVLKVIIKTDPENRGHYSKLIKEILPLPITGYKNKKEITQLVNDYANRIAKTARDSVKFNGNMWDMLEWWDKH